MSDIILKDYQIEHYKNICSISENHTAILDRSKTGNGKSIIASKFILDSKVKNGIIVCLTTIENDWKKRIQTYNLPIGGVVSYSSFRGTVDRIPKHGLLQRDENGKFTPSPLLINLVENGFILILDEIQSIKNDCNQTNAVKCVASYIFKRMNTFPIPKIKSYVYSMSSSPFDEQENCVNYFITMGIISNPILFDKNRNTLLGAEELFQYAKKFKPSEVNYVLGHNAINSKTVVSVCYNVCKDILLPCMSSSMVKNNESKLKQTIYSGYFKIPAEGHEIIQIGLNMIHIPMKENSRKEQNYEISPQASSVFQSFYPKTNINGLGGIAHGIILIQSVKSKYIIIPEVIRCFETVPNVKICLFFDNKLPLQIAFSALKKYNPVAITGKIKKNERTRLISKFQEPNLESRLLLFITGVGFEGIELDDQHGDFPRIGFGMPSFQMIKMSQIVGRIYRYNTKSHSLFFWLWSDSDQYSEISVINSINKKSKVLSETSDNVFTETIYIPIKQENIDYKNLLENPEKIMDVKSEPKSVTYIDSSFKSIF